LLPLALKAIIFAVLIFVANYTGGFFWNLVFIVVSMHFYFRDSLEWKKFFYSFAILIIYSLVITHYLIDQYLIMVSAVVFGLLFFLLLGIKKFAFINRQMLFNLLSGALFFMVAVAFFGADKSVGFDFLLYYIGVFLAFAFLFKEAIDFLPDEFPKKKKSLFVCGASFLIMEFAVLASFLPIGFLNSSALIVLVAFILEDLIFYYIKGNLNRQVVLNNLTILIIALIFIFATSKWTP